MEILATIGYIIVCILLFSFAIAIHEFGHFLAALKLGLNVERFSIGFGPAIWKKTFKGVEYRISWIPLGGYVSIPDVDPEGTKALEGASKSAKKERIPAWKEIIVAFAGPAMNIVLAAIVAIALSLIPSARFGELTTEIGSLPEDSVARRAGILPGDRITSVGGNPVATWSELLTEVQITGGKATEFKVERAGEEMSFEIAPVKSEVTDAYYIQASSVIVEGGVSRWLPARNPLKQLAWDAGAIFRVLKALVTPKEAAATGNALGGPVMIAEGIYRTVRADFTDGLGFFRFLNVNLAVINLLPIPVLDGGLILFALIALVFRRRVPDRIVGALSTGFMYLLLALMAFLIFRDSKRSYKIHTRAGESLEMKMMEDNLKESKEAGDVEKN